jgi:hypothetical protein
MQTLWNFSGWAVAWHDLKPRGMVVAGANFLDPIADEAGDEARGIFYQVTR